MKVLKFRLFRTMTIPREFEVWVFALTMIMTQLQRMFLLQPKILMDAHTRNGILFLIVIEDCVEQTIPSRR